MSKTTAAALTLTFACSSLLAACAGDAPKTPPPPPANNAAAPASNANKAPAAPAAEMKVAGMPADAQPIFAAKCAVCHGPDATGKPPAPNIFEVKDKHTPEEWVKYFENPKAFEKDSKMPPVKLTPDEAKKLADWLAATTGGAAKAAEKPEAKAPETKKS